MIESMEINGSPLSDEINHVCIRVYQQKDLEYIINRHRELYAAEYGFSSEFGDYVEKYVLEYDKCRDENKGSIWIAEADKKSIGVIAIVRVDDSTVQLRWFLIEPKMRGKGLGHKLMGTVIDFCKAQKYKHIFLWTVSTLHSARYLYREYGFILTETKDNNTWTNNLKEERWDLYLS